MNKNTILAAALPLLLSTDCATSTDLAADLGDGQGAAPNHRYTTDFNERARMLAQGLVPEGLGPDAVEMCSLL